MNKQKHNKRKEELLSWWEELELSNVSNIAKIFITIGIFCIAVCCIAKYFIQMSIGNEIRASQLSLTVSTITIAVTVISSVAGYAAIIRRARIMHKETIDVQRSIVELLAQSQDDIVQTVGQSERLVIRASSQLYEIIKNAMEALMEEKEGFWRNRFEDFDDFEESDEKDKDLEIIPLNDDPNTKPDNRSEELSKIIAEMEKALENESQPDDDKIMEVARKAAEKVGVKLQDEGSAKEVEVDDDTKELPDIKRMPKNAQRILSREQIGADTLDLNVTAVKEALSGGEQPTMSEIEKPIQEEPDQKIEQAVQPIAEQAAELGVDESLLMYYLKRAGHNHYSGLSKSDLEILQRNAEFEKAKDSESRKVS